MVAYAFDPLVQDLTLNPLQAKVYSTAITADSDGFYYRSSALVEISGDEQVKKAASAGKAMGILRSSLNTRNAPEGIDKDNLRIDVTPIGYRFLMRMTAEGSLTAGDRVCQGTVSKQAVKAMSSLAATSTVDAAALAAATTVDAAALSGATPSGEVAVLSDAAQPTIAISGAVTAETALSGTITAATSLAGGILPEEEIGIVWKGAADGAEALILVR